MRLIAFCLPLLMACGGSQAEAEMADPDDPAYAASFDHGGNDPRVSRSRGEAGGYVVLWPRVVPAEGAEALQSQATLVQARLVAMATESAGGRPVDVRPEPERACRRQGGCAAAAIGAVIVHVGGGCAVIATTSEPGEVPTHLSAWTSGVEILSAYAPFRTPPEEFVRVNDMHPCDDLEAALEANAEQIQRVVLGARRDPI